MRAAYLMLTTECLLSSSDRRYRTADEHNCLQQAHKQTRKCLLSHNLLGEAISSTTIIIIITTKALQNGKLPNCCNIYRKGSNFRQYQCFTELILNFAVLCCYVNFSTTDGNCLGSIINLNQSLALAWGRLTVLSFREQRSS